MTTPEEEITDEERRRAICAYAITLDENDVSQRGYEQLRASHEAVGNDFMLFKAPAVKPEEVDWRWEFYGFKWAWPESGIDYCPITKLRRHAYGGRNPKRRHACFWSHFQLWEICSQSNIPMIILEHDAKFIQKLDLEPLLASEYGVIGLNSPFNATRLPQKYHSVLQASEGPIGPCPEIDRWEVPQGIAGASAYLIKPWAAEQIIAKTKEVGAWPNDAIICRQLFDFIGATKTYYTEVQGLPSTTTSLS